MLNDIEAGKINVVVVKDLSHFGREYAQMGMFIGSRQFLPLIQKYTDIQELNAHILNELIEKIVVHEKEIGADGTKTQQVDIYYRFIGYVHWRDMGQNSAEVFLLPGPEGSDAAEND